ncbi:hypothetical protein GN330_03705 [Nitratireductor sp. CAU 1489]|uniref:Uncharacterized protein n=1 Tax=Nitratireductor arenosus TaxID=2682096 RepID=A0A844QEX9_9HYPH|nr:hypothetical protein [Nitratireductor arenosus]MVA96349.1 hypothetical protein [Nitratireductor arenosus]
MADFVAVLKKTIGNLGETTPEIREKVYQKARATIGAKLAAMNPPPPEAIAERQRQQLENAIREIEREFQAKAPAEPSDPLAELDALFADLSKPKPDKAKSEPAAAVTPAAPIASPRPGGVKPVAEGAPATPPASPPASSSVQGPEVDVDFQTADNADQQPLADPEFAPEDVPPPPADRGARPSFGRWIAAAAVVILVGGAAYAMWLNKDGFAGLFGEGQTEIAAQDAGEEAVSEPVAETQEPQPEAEPEEEAATAPDPVAPAETAAEEPQKFTQRLNTDGSEIDEGPAGGETSIGEGTSMAAATQPEGEPLPGTGEAAAEAGDNGGEPGAAGEAGIPVAQKAIFYEERTAVAEGTADSGTVVWSLAQESPGNDLPPEPAIRAEAIIPDKDLKLRLTIRRNADQTLPASHIVELIFLTPENFASGPIDNVLRMTMKETEQAAGNPLRGIPAKIADGFFLVALNDADTEVVQNMRMLRDQNWIDLPIVYKSGRRALVTMEKGLPGEKIFEEALKAWEAASSG